MALSRRALKGVLKKAVTGLKAKKADAVVEKYKKEREITPLPTEMERPAQAKQIPSVEKFKPVRAYPKKWAEKAELPIKIAPMPTKMPSVPTKPKEEKIEGEPEKIGAEIKMIAKRAKSESPVIFDFPKISEELKSRGVLPIQEVETGLVRGIPQAAHTLPKEEVMKKISSEWEPPSLDTIDARYPLIEPYAYTVIKWNEKLEALSYTLIEPPLTEKEKKTLEQLKTLIIDLLDINLMDITNVREVQNYLKKKVNQIIVDYEIKITEIEYNKVLYYIYRNFLGLETIEPLMQDPEIEDISCDGANIPIFVFHRKYGSLKTNILFEDQDKLNKFITKLAQRCGRHISVAEPLLDGALPDGSRLQATFSVGGDIATRGSTFTIRKFTKDPLTIIDFMKFGTIPALMAAYLWMAIEYKSSILVSGGTATGKTSALNTLSLFLPPEAKIVSIEDTPELRLPHEHWVAKIARTGYGPADRSGRRKGEITMFDLLRAALRERPDELIVGEVRGQEAYVLFQGMATGHAGLATIHAESVDAVINRLKTKPINLSPGLLQHLDIIVIMGFSRIKGIDVRRIKEVIEIIGIDEKSGKPITNQLFRWIPSGDYFEFASDRSYVLNKIIEEKGIPEKSIWEELQRRTTILEWMKKQDIRYYEDVGRVIAIYYKNPEEVLRKISGFEKYEPADI